MSKTQRAATSFRARVLSAVRAIPVGRVSTYGDVAARAGRPGAARAVGNIMRDCHDPSVPCHRVVAAGGQLGGYGGREDVKRYLLEREGCLVRGTRLHDFTSRRWKSGSRARKTVRLTPSAKAIVVRPWR
jgi:methylated-DNA-[protein]-cysteine S-methyltransferase